MRTTGAIKVEKKRQQQYQDAFLNKKIVAPEKLKILVLSGNDLVNDQLQFIQKCVSLIKLDLSNNNITSISQKMKMNHLRRLKILYLHNNQISKVDGIQSVFTIPQLTQLTIKNNPIEKLPRIEHLLVNMLPELKILNDRVIFVEERSSERVWERKNVYVEKGMTEWKSRENHETHYMKLLDFQIKYFDNVWLYNNPIVFIQRHWRKAHQEKTREEYLVRTGRKESPNRIQEKRQNTQFLRGFFEEWRQISKNRLAVKKALEKTETYPYDKTYLTYPFEQYRICLRNFRIQEYVFNFVKKIRNKLYLKKMATKIYNNILIKKYEFAGSQSLSKLIKQKKFYFTKDQRHLLDNFLLHIQENFHWAENLRNQIKIYQDRQFLTTRLIDPAIYSQKPVYSTLTYFLWPSIRAIFLKKKKFVSPQKKSIINIRTLSYIKNRDKVLTKEEYQKSIKIYDRVNKFSSKEYENALDCFECSNELIFQMFLRYTFYHNTKTIKFVNKLKKEEMVSLLENYNEPFVIYLDEVLQRTTAAVKIQQNWRKYIIQKHQQESIYEKMKKSRAILKIQRFMRDRVFYHRLSFQKILSNHIKLFKTNSFYLLKEIYYKMIELCDQNKKVRLYKGVRLLEKISSDGKKSFDLQWQMQKNTFFPNLRNIIYEGRENKSQVSSSKITDIHSLLHVNSQISEITYGNNKYFEFTFQSSSQAKLRMCIIALLTYRVWGSKFILPLSRDTLEFQEFRLKTYKQFSIVDVKQIGTKRRREEKIIKNTKIELNGVFLFNKQFPEKKQVKTCFLEFYQKRFQDFPSKHHLNLKYFLPDFIVAEIKKQKELIIQSLAQNNQNSLTFKDNERRAETVEVRQKDATISVSKIDKKRLSLYDFGYKTGGFSKEEKTITDLKRKQYLQTIDHQRKQGQYLDAITKRQNVDRAKQIQLFRKKQIEQKKKQQLVKIRERISKQKNANSTIKSMKNSERNETVRKKAQRVRQFKSRVVSQKHKDDEEDFVQQGNFVMEQQLKMIVMRSKMKSIQSKKKRVNGTGTGENQSRKSSFSHSHSLYSQPGKKEQIVRQNLNHTISNTYRDESNENKASGEEKKILNLKPSKKSRNNSIGAYLRDPSYVHGVFPEEYYPMETKGNFRFFPPL